jgi:hypothetical protein
MRTKKENFYPKVENLFPFFEGRKPKNTKITMPLHLFLGGLRIALFPGSGFTVFFVPSSHHHPGTRGGKAYKFMEL